LRDVILNGGEAAVRDLSLPPALMRWAGNAASARSRVRAGSFCPSNQIDKPFPQTLLYCVPHLTVASFGQDFQEGLPVLPVRQLSSHFQQLNAGDDA